MSAARRVAVLCEEPLPETREALRALDAETRLLDVATPAGELERLASTAIVLWLPHWALLDDRQARSIEAWIRRAQSDGAVRGAEEREAARAAVECTDAGRSGGRGHVLLARAVIDLVDAEIPYPASVIGSLPGAVAMQGVAPVPISGATRTELEHAVRVRPPRTLSEHLLDVNRQSSVAARLRDLAGEEPTVARLAVEPLWLLGRALWGARGSRRTVLSRAALEAYRGTLAVAKLWERRMVPPRVAP